MPHAKLAGLAGALLVCATLAVASRLAAEEAPAPGAQEMKPQKPITHPLAKSLLGTWTTRMTGKMTGTGTATFALGVGDTCLMQDEASVHSMPGGATVKGAGHGMYRIADDGKTITAWWLDNFEPRMTEVVGTVTDDGFDMSGTTSTGKFRIVLTKTGTGLEVKSFMGASPEPMWTQTYERAAPPRPPR